MYNVLNLVSPSMNTVLRAGNDHFKGLGKAKGKCRKNAGPGALGNRRAICDYTGLQLDVVLATEVLKIIGNPHNNNVMCIKHFVSLQFSYM